MANGEIAHDEQFHHLPQCFQKLSAAEASESICKWERVKADRNQQYHVRLTVNPFPHTTHLQQTTLKTYLQNCEKKSP